MALEGGLSSGDLEAAGRNEGGPRHVPVLLAEVIAAAEVQAGQRWIDGTFGRGGHTQALLEKGAQVLALDQDQAAEETARALEARWPGQFIWRNENFRNLAESARARGWDRVEGVLLDLGVSSPQLETAERGFSFRADGPLDMRMDRREPTTAADLINTLGEQELAKIFYEQGGEKDSRRVARAVVARRQRSLVRTTQELADLVAEALPFRRSTGVHPATKVFQALRIVVNREQEALLAALPQAMRMLSPQGKLAVISFHSGEDRVVKNFLREYSSPWLDTPGHPNTLPNPKNFLEKVKRYLPSDRELAENPRARSARLRVAQRNAQEIL